MVLYLCALLPSMSIGHLRNFNMWEDGRVTMCLWSFNVRLVPEW